MKTEKTNSELLNNLAKQVEKMLRDIIEFRVELARLQGKAQAYEE